ncbi:MAG: hypothetical protein PVJ73_09255 [Acidobacteriota bacterium]
MRRRRSSSRSAGSSRLFSVERGRRRLIVGLFLVCLAFWNGADFLHEDEGPEYAPDCPVCSLARVTSCETPTVFVAQACPLLIPVSRVAIPQSVERAGADHSLPAKPRGPPAVA